MKYTAIVNTKGQVTIPADLRKRYGLTTGITVVFAEENGRLILIPRKSPTTKTKREHTAES